MQTHENQKKIRKEIVAVITVAAVCLIVAATFVVQYAVKTFNEEKAINEFAESFGEQLDDTSKKASELKIEFDNTFQILNMEDNSLLLFKEQCIQY